MLGAKLLPDFFLDEALAMADEFHACKKVTAADAGDATSSPVAAVFHQVRDAHPDYVDTLNGVLQF